MSPLMIAGIVIAVIIILIVVWAICVYNSVNKSDMKCKEALSGIDVALTKRYDLLTKLLATAKKYAEFEKSTILETIKLRSDSPIQEKIANNNKMDEAQTTLFGLAENYPDLKASQNYAKLQDGIQDAEDHLQASRRAYNAAVDHLNNYFITFPNSIIANKTKVKQRQFFEAEENKRQDVVID